MKKKPVRRAASGPFFTVVIPVYDKKNYVRRSVGSVLKQTFRDFELIVVDDGSKDGSPAIVRSLRDRRLRLIVQPNAGVSAARNHGVMESRGKYMAFLDADDDWDPDYLESLKGLIEEFPGAGLYATNYWVDNGLHKAANPVRLPEGWRGTMRNFYELSYHGRPPFSTNTACLPAALAKAIPFPPGIKAGEDLLVWYKASLQHDTAYWNKPLATYYVAVTENTHATYFGPKYHLDWLEVGEAAGKEGLLTEAAWKYVVWATLIQIRKMIANGRRWEALAKWWHCPKAYFPRYQVKLLAMMFLPAGVPGKIRRFFSRAGKGKG